MRLAVVCAVLALTAVLTGCGVSNGGAVEVSSVAPTPLTETAPPLRTPAPERTAALEAPSPSGTPTVEAHAERPAPVSTLSDEAPVPGTAAGWSIVIPELAVRAPVAAFGLSPTGVMEVPADATTVAWYTFTSVPGAPGNAVLAAHVDWRGERGVFNRLIDLAPGSLVTLRAPGGEEVTYEVRHSELVDPRTADVAALIGGRTGDSTLTLITCGGEFNRELREYERRVVVHAVKVEGRG